MRELIIGAMKSGWRAYAVLLAAVALFGYGAGHVAGNRLVKGVILGESRLPLLVSRPVGQFYDIYQLLNSGNPFSRLCGYYALVDNMMIDESFLIERYGVERFAVTRKTILWALSFSENSRKVAGFYRSIYGESDREIQSEIRGLMKRVCRQGGEDCALPGGEKQ